MGNVGGWNPARAQVGRERGVIEDGQLFVAAERELLVSAAGVAGCGPRPDVQPAAVRMVSRISARHRRRIGQAYAWDAQADWCQRRKSAQRRPMSTRQ